jgi:hypothetical protein
VATSFFGGAFYDGEFYGDGSVQPPAPEPSASGGRYKQHRFSTIHKGELYVFDTLEALQEFFREQPKLKKKKRRGTPLRVEVAPAFQEELYSFDLPAIQPLVDQRRFDELAEIMARFELARFHLAAQIREDEEDLLLLA